jgi:hypothetical protein
MDVTLDIAALAGALALPLVVLWLFLAYRNSLSKFLDQLPGRLQSVSVAGFSLELATATPDPLSSLEGVRVDLRHAGTSVDVNDSTLRTFYEQVGAEARMDYAVVDLGAGAEWLSSRLYILAVILSRWRGLRAFVFVHTREGTRRRFLGVCDTDRVRWRLAARWPLLESALAAAELRMWGHPFVDPDIGQGPPPQHPLIPAPTGRGHVAPPIPGFVDPALGNKQIVDDEGRVLSFGGPEPAADLLRSFLDAVQRPPMATPHPQWQPLPSAPTLVEYAIWLTGELLEDVLDDSLDVRFLRLPDVQGWTEAIRLRAVVEHSGDWVALVDDEHAFDRLVDRRSVLEQVAQHAVSNT